MKWNMYYLITIIFLFGSAVAGAEESLQYHDFTDTLGSKWEFPYEDDTPWNKYENYARKDEKIFGKTIARQLTMIDHHYIVYSSSENDYHPKIIKPAIYKSLNILKSHYKDLIRDEVITPRKAEQEFQTYLIKGYVCYSEETGEIEEILQEADSVEEIKIVFDQIKLVKPIHLNTKKHEN